MGTGLPIYGTLERNRAAGRRGASGFHHRRPPAVVQLIGRPNDESTLFSLAAQIEAERPWADSRPPKFV